MERSVASLASQFSGQHASSRTTGRASPRPSSRPATPSNKLVPRPTTPRVALSSAVPVSAHRGRALAGSAADAGTHAVERQTSSESFRRKRSAASEPTVTPTTPSSTSSGPSGALAPSNARAPPRPARPSSALSFSSAPRTPLSRARPRHSIAAPTLATTGRSVSAPMRPEPCVDVVVAEGELGVGGGGSQSAGAVLVEIRAGRSIARSDYGDNSIQQSRRNTLERLQDCSMDVAIPSSPPSPSLPSPLPSPTRSPLLRASPIRIHSSPTSRLHPSGPPRSFSDSFQETLEPMEPIGGTRSMSISPSTSVSSALSLPHPALRHPSSRNSSTSSISLAKKDEKRRRRGSNQVRQAGGSPEAPPEFHTYTSFEAAFDLPPPPSPPPSPKATPETKSWWGLGA